MQIVRIGLDLAKYVFEVHGVDAHGKIVVRKTAAVSTFFANLPPCLVGMEASNGAHYWASVLTDLGHQVRLISPQFVTPYVKSNKNDRNDAEAICEAVGRPTMRFVPPKSSEQLAIQAVHRIRHRLVATRVRLVNHDRFSGALKSPADPKRTCRYKSNRQPTALGLGGRSYGVWSFLYGKSKIPTFT